MNFLNTDEDVYYKVSINVDADVRRIINGQIEEGAKKFGVKNYDQAAWGIWGRGFRYSRTGR